LFVTLCATGSAVGASTLALKPTDPIALQATIEGAAKELLLPGAMILLHTPQGKFVLGYGTTELGVTNAPRRNVLPGRLKHQDDDGRRDRATDPGRESEFRRSDLQIRSGYSQRKRDYDQSTS
jgi:hypothetical protein